MISCEEMKAQYVRTLDEGLRFRNDFKGICRWYILDGVVLDRPLSTVQIQGSSLDSVLWNHSSLTVEKTRRYVNDISDDNLADFIDNFAKMVLIDYTKLDFPSLLVYLCQRRGTRKYIGDMFEVCQSLMWHIMWHNSCHLQSDTVMTSSNHF